MSIYQMDFSLPFGWDTKFEFFLSIFRYQFNRPIKDVGKLNAYSKE